MCMRAGELPSMCPQSKPVFPNTTTPYGTPSKQASGLVLGSPAGVVRAVLAETETYITVGGGEIPYILMTKPYVSHSNLLATHGHLLIVICFRRF